ncbi:MAG: glycosyltransferase [Saprospiraceae bacterium]
MSNDIIYFTLFPWENAYSSVSLSFTREFCKNNRVFYINMPYTVKDFITKRGEPLVKERQSHQLRGKMRYEKIPTFPDNVIAVHPPMTLPINFLPPGKMYDALYAYNNRVVLNTIKQVIEDYDLKDFIYLNCFNPYYAGVLPKDFGQLVNIYQCIDDMYEEDYTAKHGAVVEEKILAEADIALVTSRNLLKIKGVHNPNTHVLHNAVDMNIFKVALEQEFPKPKEIAHVKTKIIGFTGNLNEYRVNYGLIKKVAEYHQDKTVVLVGPLNSDDYKTHGLDQMDNVILTGGKNIRELPKFLQHFDVTMIPFHCNRLTASVYPLKINEYLSAGRPVVTSNFSEDIRSFEEVIYVTENDDDFIKTLDQAIAENDEAKVKARFAVANSNTWKARVREFWDIVEGHLVGETA